MKVLRLLATRHGRLYPQETFLYSSLLHAESTQGLEGLSMKNSNDIIGHRTHDLQACSAVPQPTAPPRGPLNDINRHVFTMNGGISSSLQSMNELLK